MNDPLKNHNALDILEKELADLELKRAELLKEIGKRKSQSLSQSCRSSFSETDKIKLFRSLFKGRSEVYPRRFESKKTGKSGYTR